MLTKNLKHALFIDGDNVSPDIVPKIFSFLDNKENFNTKNFNIKQVYGQCSDLGIGSHKWTTSCLEYSISPVHCINYKKGKNSTDIVMVMDILETIYIHPEIDNFIIVTNDSDFTALVLKLKKYNKNTIIFTDVNQVSTSLKNSCNEFYNLSEEAEKIKLEKSYTLPEILTSIFNQAFIMNYVNEEGYFNIDRIPAISATIGKILPLKQSQYKKLHLFLEHECSEFIEFKKIDNISNIVYMIKPKNILNINYKLTQFLNNNDLDININSFLEELFKNAKKLGFLNSNKIDISYIPIIIKDSKMEISYKDFGYKKVKNFVLDNIINLEGFEYSINEEEHKIFILKK